MLEQCCSEFCLLFSLMILLTAQWLFMDGLYFTVTAWQWSIAQCIILLKHQPNHGLIIGITGRFVFYLTLLHLPITHQYRWNWWNSPEDLRTKNTTKCSLQMLKKYLYVCACGLSKYTCLCSKILMTLLVLAYKQMYEIIKMNLSSCIVYGFLF